jgi:hypothetical protein
MADASVRPRYIAILCVVALAILVAGVVLRPRKIPIPVRSESEIYKLQLLAEQRDLQNTRLLFESKARDLVAKSQAARATPDKFPFRPPTTGEYLLLVSAQDSGEPVWAVTSAAGVTKTRCEDRELEEVGTTIAIPASLANAVAFGMEGDVAGLVVACGDRRMVTTPEGLRQASQKTIRALLMECCRLKFALTGDAAEIIEVGEDSRLGKAGVKAGDRVVALNGQRIRADSDLEPLLGGGEIQLSIDRPKKVRPRTLKVPAVEAPK